MSSSDKILALVGAAALLFIAVMTAVFCVKGAVPDTLIQCTLGAGGTEALLLAGIKISKVLAEGRRGAHAESAIPETDKIDEDGAVFPSGEEKE